MYKSRVVKLVLLNSVLAFSGCARTCPPQEVKKDDPRQAVDKDKQPVRSCHGSRGGGGGHFFFWGGGGRGVARPSGARPGQPGAGNVGRGGFGSTAHGTGT